MAGAWRLESHIKLLYCLHLITLWAVIFCFSYVYFCLALKIHRLDDYHQPTEPRYRSSEKQQEQQQQHKLTSLSVAVESATRTKRNPTVLPNNGNDNAPSSDDFYQYTLKELLQMENEKPKNLEKSKRKRIKLKILFNETSDFSKQPPLISEVDNPAVVDLPPVEDDNKPGDNLPRGDEAWVVIPMYSKSQMNYLKEFCFTLNDFCSETGGDQLKFNKELQITTTKEPVKQELEQQDGNKVLIGSPATYTISSLSSTKHYTVINASDELGPNLVYFFANTSQTDASSQTFLNNSGTNGTFPYNITNGHSTMPTASTDENVYEDESEETDRVTSRSTMKRKPHFTKMPKKRTRCYIHQFGKHVEVGYRKMFYGAWMRDPKPRSEEDDHKRWVVEHFAGIFLLEYGSESDLYKPELNPVKTYMLPYMYEGTSHVIYNGAFYYQRSGTPNILRYVLHTNRTREATLPGAAYKESSYLYADNDMTYFDLAVDEYGLWVIYRKEGETNALYVSRMHPRSLNIIRTWNVTEVDTQTIGNAWVTCGILYMVKNSRDQNTTLYYAYDLYKHKYASLHKIEWTNIYGNANMITYNPLDRKIYIYDNGHLILLPVALTYAVD